MARNGKIARLPRHVRDELNQRLDNAEPGVKLLEWLNALPEVKQVLENNFDSQPITKQNLSQWKGGGYQTWLRLQECREQVETLREQSSDLEKDTGDCSIADRITTLLSVQLLTAIQQLDTIKDPKERWLQTKDLLRELHRLRREDHHAARIRLAREQWEDTWERRYDQDEETKKKRNKKKLLKWLHSLHDRELNVQLLGGGPDGRKWAHWFHCVENDLPLPKDLPLPYWWTDDDDSDDDSPSSSNTSAQAQSKPVKPSQSKSNVGQASCLSPSLPHTNKSHTPVKLRAPARPVSNHKTSESSNSSKPNQSKSNVAQESCLSPSLEKPCDSEQPDPGQPDPKPQSLPERRTPARPDSNHDKSEPSDSAPSAPGPPTSSTLPSPAEMLRAITVHQKFK